MKGKEISVIDQIRAGARLKKETLQVEERQNQQQLLTIEEIKRNKEAQEQQSLRDHELAVEVIAKARLDMPRRALENILSQFRKLDGDFAQFLDFEYYFGELPGYRGVVHSLRNPRQPLTIDVVYRFHSTEFLNTNEIYESGDIEFMIAQYVRSDVQMKDYAGKHFGLGVYTHDYLHDVDRMSETDVFEKSRQIILDGISKWIGHEPQKEEWYGWSQNNKRK